MSALSPEVRVILFLGLWVVWFLALVELRKSRRQKAVKVDPRARWGLALESAAYVVICTHGPRAWAGGLEVWRAVAGSVVAAFSIALFWNAVGTLGRQWRFDAGLNADHELVQNGAYSIVRHPIYASMFGMLIADGFLIGTLPGWPLAIALFVAGTEIRVRVEDALLLARFGGKFAEWKRSKPAYLPFVR